jgi:hypothetical protein
MVKNNQFELVTEVSGFLAVCCFCDQERIQHTLVVHLRNKNVTATKDFSEMTLHIRYIKDT